MSDGQLDCTQLKRRISMPLGRQLRPRNLIPKQQDPIVPLDRMISFKKKALNQSEPHLFLVDGSRPENRGKIFAQSQPTRRLTGMSTDIVSCKSKAIYSYRIVNQRLSHVAAFSPPRSVNPNQQQIAYRFVFTNAI